MMYLYFTNTVVFLMMGVALLLVWRIHAAQTFARDIGWSSIAAGVVSSGYYFYRTEPAPYAQLAFIVASAGAVLNLLLLCSGVMRLAGRRLPAAVMATMAVPMVLLLALLPLREKMVFWPLVVFLFVSGLGLLATRWLWRRDRIERSVGPLLVLLGLNQLIVVVQGEEGMGLHLFLAIVLRVAMACVFLFSALERSVREASRLYARFAMLTEHSLQGVVVTDGNSVLYSNPAARTIYGMGQVVSTVDPLNQVPASSFSADALLYHHQQLHEHDLDVTSWEGRRRVADGRERDLAFTAWRIDWDGKPATQILITDDTERLAAARELAYQASHDELTGLPNRTVLMERLRRLCDTGEGSGHCVLVVLNINRFKLFNQSQGQVAGDNVLKAFAGKLQNCLGPDAELMRLGGDEFAILDRDAGNARNLAWRLHGVCLQPLHVPGGEFFIDASMGMAICPDNGGDAEALLRAANAAMYHAKRTPGTSLEMAEQRYEQLSSQALEQEQALRKGIKGHELYLYYQPKVDATSGRLLGFEALARWHRAGIGDVSPVDFISVAEHTGMIAELGAMLLQQACAQIAAWRAALGECVPVAVNVSPMQLLNPGFLQLVEDALQHCGVPARYLTLEITESAAVENLDNTCSQLQQLRELGVQVAMDDFGTGFSSLSMLRSLPLHSLKIDRALIDPLPAPDALAVVTAICQLADALQLRVVAEGVETPAHAEAARQAGCDELQGFLYARPLTPEDAEQWLRQALADRQPALELAPQPQLAG